MGKRDKIILVSAMAGALIPNAGFGTGSEMASEIREGMKAANEKAEKEFGYRWTVMKIGASAEQWMLIGGIAAGAALLLWLILGGGSAGISRTTVMPLLVTVLICVLQILIYRFFSDSEGAVTFVMNQLHFTVRNGYDFHQALTEQIERWHGVVQESAYTRNQEEGTTDYDLIVQSRKEITYKEMKEFISAHEEIISCTNNTARK